jgi:hypothetical protein
MAAGLPSIPPDNSGTSVSTCDASWPHPWAESASERGILMQEMRAIVGSSIAAVRYLQPEGSTAHATRVCHGFDEAGVGVEITTSHGTTFAAVWQMDGYNEGLSFGPGSGEARHGRYALRRLDVSGSSRWRALVGQTVAAIGARLAHPERRLPTGRVVGQAHV